MTRQLDRAGLGFIASHEACYLYGYPDPASGGEPITDGIGHTAAAGGRRPRLNARITLAEAARQFRADMERFTGAVERAVPGMPQHRLAAATSLHFNTGAFVSGTVDDKLRRGDEAGALATWMLYVNAAGKRMQGLVNRRRDEVSLFRTGVYPVRSILVKDAPGSAGRAVPVSQFPFDAAPAPLALDPEVITRPAVVPPMPGNFILALIKYIWEMFK